MRLDFTFELGRIRERVAVQFFAHGIEDFAGGLHAQVCGEQRRLQILQDGWINPALTEKNRVDGLRQRRLRLADRLPQLLEKRRFRLGFSKQGNHPSRASLLAQLKIVADRVTGVVGRRR